MRPNTTPAAKSSFNPHTNTVEACLEAYAVKLMEQICEVDEAEFVGAMTKADAEAERARLVDVLAKVDPDAAIFYRELARRTRIVLANIERLKAGFESL
jgi:hypothetical protein